MSVPFAAREAASWTGGSLRQGDPEARFASVSIDTRTLSPGALFVAIQGARYDAHEFLAEAAAREAAGLLVEAGRELPASARALPVVEVDDTTRALGRLAAGHRAPFGGPVIAITGSNGKTTTKEMCAAILAEAAPCLRNRGTLNNQWGLPLTLLERESEHRSVVVEIGTNHRGEVAALAAIAAPTVGVVTNVGTAHIEYLGSREEIAREKGDLLASLGAEGVAVVNADDPGVCDQAKRTRARVVRFGRGSDADVRAEHTREGFAFELVAPGGRIPVEVEGLGETTVANALAAAAAALAGGASLEHVARGLARYRPVPGRMARRALAHKMTLIDDTYNANLQSVEEALRSLARLKGSARGVAVLGDMGELGAAAVKAHRDAGELTACLGIDFLFALGKHARDVAEGALAAGMTPQRVHASTDPEETSRRVRGVLQREDWILVKGSRAMRMEQVVEALAAVEEER